MFVCVLVSFALCCWTCNARDLGVTSTDDENDDYRWWILTRPLPADKSTLTGQTTTHSTLCCACVGIIHHALRYQQFGHRDAAHWSVRDDNSNWRARPDRRRYLYAKASASSWGFATTIPIRDPHIAPARDPHALLRLSYRRFSYQRGGRWCVWWYSRSPRG